MERSHTYELSGADVVKAFLPTLSGLALLAVLLHATAFLGLLPARPITLHADETVLRHQVRAALSRHPAEIVLVGDSTCLAGVDAATLSESLRPRAQAINLGLFIGIDLGSYAQVVRDFSTLNPGQVRWVVLLISPARLGTAGEPTLWRQMREEALRSSNPPPDSLSLVDLTGARFLRERLAGRLLPQPLRGKEGGRFGFTTDLDRHMTAHHGSVVDFGEVASLPRDAALPVQLSDAFAAECLDFRRGLPGDVKLAVGVTPRPAVLPRAKAEMQYARYLDRLASLLRPDVVLSNLPPTLPRFCFSPSLHLNPVGQQHFTLLLARELSGMP